jgi:hypothetical protein
MASEIIRRNLYVFTLNSVVDVTNISYKLLLVEKLNLKRHSNALWLIANKNSYSTNDAIFFIMFSTYQSKAKR